MASDTSLWWGWPSRSEVEAASNAVLVLNRCGTCSTCNGYFGSANDQAVCSTCHAFLYANDLDAEGLALHQSEDRNKDNDDSDRDSGNEEPPEQDHHQPAASSSLYPPQSAAVAAAAKGSRRTAAGGGGGCTSGKGDDDRVLFSGDQNQELELLSSGSGTHHHQVLRNGYHLKVDAAAVAGGQRPPLELRPFPSNGQRQQDLHDHLDRQLASIRNWRVEGEKKRPLSQQPQYNHHLQHVHLETLSDRLALLTIPRKCGGGEDEVEKGRQVPAEKVVKSLPPEILMIIFSFLDDISLYAVANVCGRWKQLVMTLTQWEEYTRRRWPLFKPLTPVTDWFATYSSLVDSCFCLTCIYQMAEVPRDINSGLRKKRLDHDLRGLVLDPPEGIKAQPLDSSYYHWQASVTGPIGSPYEGGLFYLYLKIPFNYPFDPPEVRFLSKIFHPNVSRHGDVGIDSILKHGWAVSLRISTVLISIQSLLTDPYTNVCMEPDIGRLYDNNRRLFDSVARLWTWRFAMLDVPAFYKKANILMKESERDNN